MSLQAINFDLQITPGSIPPVLHMSQYDSGRQYTAYLKDDTNTAFIPGAGATAKLKGFNAAGVPWEQAATVDGSTVVFTPSGAATDQFGIMPVTIEITVGSEKLTPLLMIFDIQRAGYTNEQAVRSPEFETALEAAVAAAIASGGLGFTEAFKQALLACFAHVAWVDEYGKDYYDALEAALNPPQDLEYISAVYTQGGTVYDTDSLDSLRANLVVYAHYTSDTEVETGYALSGTLSAGTSTITVSFGGKTTTFDVTVTHDTRIPSEYQAVEYIEATGTQYIVLDSNFGLAPGRLSAVIECSGTIYNSPQGVLSVTDGLGQWFGLPATHAFGFGSTSYFTTVDNTELHTYSVEFGAENATATCDGETVTRSISNAQSGKLILFGIYSNVIGYLARAKIAACEITVDGQLAYNLVPCYKKSDGTIGMYDRIGNTFYTNNGSGTFLKGGDI